MKKLVWGLIVLAIVLVGYSALTNNDDQQVSDATEVDTEGAALVEEAFDGLEEEAAMLEEGVGDVMEGGSEAAE